MASPSHSHDDKAVSCLLRQVNPRKEIERFVRDVETPGTFAVGSSLLAPPADLTVEGLGNIRLPLASENMDVLRAASELAPYGHGAETKVDESVRRAWQIDGASIGLSKEFTEAVGRRHALRAAEKLGLRAKALGVEARLYKLVMYETGGHFRPHKDTEKEAGMFGTLVVQLPTYDGHEGGTLVVRHRGMQQSFAWEDPDGSYHERASAAGAAAGAAAATVPGEAGADVASSSPPSLPVRCAAFYGDCEHELLPVTSGVRLCLLYNLVRTTPGPPPVAAVGQEGSAAQLRLSDAVAAWSRPDSRCGTSKFILPLEHEYTEASLSFGGLKGRDRAVADALRACRGLDLYLATVEKHEHGTAEEEYGYGRRGYRNKRYRGYDCYDDSDCESDDEDKVMDEVLERSVTIEKWVDASDRTVQLDLNVDIKATEILGSHAGDVDFCDDGFEHGGGGTGSLYEDVDEEVLDLLFGDVEPFQREYEGYMGNCSPTLDLWYRTAILIFWPTSAKIRVTLDSKGPGAALSTARKHSEEEGPSAPLPLGDLAMIVALAGKKPNQRYVPALHSRPPSHRGHAFVKDAAHTVSVLNLCATAGAAGLDSSRRFLRVLAGGAKVAVGTPGLRSEGVARAVAALVRKVGWSAVGKDVARLVQACSLAHAGNVAVLVGELSTLVVDQPQPQPQQESEMMELTGDVKVEVPELRQKEQPQQPQQQQQQQQQPEDNIMFGCVKTEVQAIHQESKGASLPQPPAQQQQQSELKGLNGNVTPEAHVVSQQEQQRQQQGTSISPPPPQPPKQQQQAELKVRGDVKAEVPGEGQQDKEERGTSAGKLPEQESLAKLETQRVVSDVKAEVPAMQQQQQHQQHQQQGASVQAVPQPHPQPMQSPAPQKHKGDVKEGIQQSVSSGVPASLPLPPPAPTPSASSPALSAGGLVAATYVSGVTSNPGALDRISSGGVAHIVRLLLLDMPCFSGKDGLSNPLLTFFAGVGRVRLQVNVLAAAVHEFRRRFEVGGSATAARSAAVTAYFAATSGGEQPRPSIPAHHSAAVVALATGLYARGFEKLIAAAVKTYAEDVLWLGAQVYGAGGLEQGFVGAAVNGARSGDAGRDGETQAKLKVVLTSRPVHAAVRSGNAFWGALVSERLKKLEAIAPPVLCWRQPTAIFSDPHVQQFLRGPQRSMTYGGMGTSRFRGIAQARDFARVFDRSYRGDGASAVAQGTGRNACVTITKSKSLYEQKERAHAEVRREAVFLRGLLNDGVGAIRGVVGGVTVGGASSGGGSGTVAFAECGGSAAVRPLTCTSGNVARAPGAAPPRNGKQSVRQRPQAEVIDLCDSS